jgi:hypothetical protein
MRWLLAVERSPNTYSSAAPKKRIFSGPDAGLRRACLVFAVHTLRRCLRLLISPRVRIHGAISTLRERCVSFLAEPSRVP